MDLIYDEEGRVDNFVFLNDINQNKQNILSTNPELEDQYSPRFINLGLSQSLDTIFLANDMNELWQVLPKKLQFDYLFYKVRKSFNRKGKWATYKERTDIILEAIQNYYNVSPKKAKEYKKILNTKQLNEIVDEMSIGGTIKKQRE